MFGFFGLDGDRDSSEFEDDELFFRQLSRRRGRRRRNNFAEMIMGLTAFLGEQDPDYMDDYQEDSMEDLYPATVELQHGKPGKVSSLLELSSVAVAKNYCCERLEGAQPPLDEGLLRKVAFWAFPQDMQQVRVLVDMTNGHWDAGESLISQDKIREMWQVGFMVTAYITKFTNTTSEEIQGTDIRVSLTFEQQRIVSSSCSECRAQIWCQHIIAAIIYRIKFSEKVTVHAPMTETLSTLNRVQLQKLLQYAVQEDPAGILGKVFKHLDEVRDSNSNMNREQGAPDPTFGYHEIGKTQWELSLESFVDSFHRQLDILCNRRLYYDSGSSYPVTYDLTKKIKSPLYRYLRKILDLSRRGEPMLAVKALATITDAVMTKLQSVHSSENHSLRTFTKDLVGTYTKLALSPCLGKEARSGLLRTILSFSNTPTEYDLTIVPSGWADLPSLYKVESLSNCAFEMLGENDDQSRHTKCWLFREPLAALSLDQCRQGQWPEELMDLLEDRVSVEDSSYSEDICIMLARLDTLVYVEPHLSIKLCRLASKILHALEEMALKDSALEKHCDFHSLGYFVRTRKCRSPDMPEKSLEETSKTETRRENTPGQRKGSTGKGVKRKGSKSQGKGKRPASGKGKGPAAKKPRVSIPDHFDDCNEDFDMYSISKGQLAYAMLYTLRTIIAGERVLKQVFEEPQYLCLCTLLALELGRHRTVQDNIEAAAQDWLLTLENSLCTYLMSNRTYAIWAVSVYLDAYDKGGMDTYRGCYPLHMLDGFLHLISRNEHLKEARADEMLKICSRVLIDLQFVLERYNYYLPRSCPTNSSQVMIGLVFGGHKNFIHKKLQGIIEVFVGNVNETNEEHIMLFNEVVLAMTNIESIPVLQVFTKALRLNAIKIWACKPALIGDPHPMRETIQICSKLLGHSLQKTKTQAVFESEERNAELNFLGSLLKHLGLHGLKQISEKYWETIMSCEQLAGLILQFHKDFGWKSLPSEMVELVKEYASASGSHGIEVCDLLALFQLSDPDYTDLIAMVRDNSQHYVTDALFRVAQLHLKNKCGKDKEQVMDMETMDLVERAFHEHRKPSNVGSPIPDSFVKWLCAACASGRTNGRSMSKAGTAVFKKMVEIVCSCASDAPDTLLHVLQNLEKTESGLLMKNATPIYDKLLEAYKAFFMQRIAQANHNQYAAVINEMIVARMQCKTHIKKGNEKGEVQFDKQVVALVRSTYSSKKKLMKMLTAQFGDVGKK